MLTKDLIRYRTYKGRLHPKFIDTTLEYHLELATEIIALFDPNDTLTREELQQASAAIINSSRDIKLAKGLYKLMLDGATFSHPEELDYSEIRSSIFAEVAHSIANAQDFESFQRAMRDKEIPSDIYADHPDKEQLISSKETTATKLLNKYNCSIVQSLLLQSDKVSVSLIKPPTAQLRQLFKYLKFFRLLASITEDKTNKSILHILIDGPGSIFENVQKYGLQLASFFPALCLLDNWQLSAEVTVNNRRFALELDQSAGLVSHYNNFTAFIPQEVRAFQDYFAKKITDWKISKVTPFIKAGGGALIFPDLTFKHTSGKTVHMELFHKWHATQLLQRLEFCKSYKKSDLILGVEHSVEKKPHMHSAISESDFFTNKGFLFREFPALTQVKKLLESLL